ncbi:MAG: DNA-3-methyladenine glycosylase 2 [Lachnospiraceae bacterium]|nr:DNA-3-methyladenine glycosylase 2 [Ruminococcus sp.]MCM1276005.1 DNA-3-methyladenine glycosylase 2 [Lachnospiraceae bacterium]
MSVKVNNSNFDLRQTFLCGQCFRWKETENGAFSGVAKGRRLTLSEENGKILIDGISERELPEWRVYFDLDADYSEYIRRFSADKTLKAACEGSAGIRILRQEPFETLISFIISQNNNIPRISGIIGRLCGSFGEDIGSGDFAFPTAERLRGIEPGDLAPLRAGFRAKYIVDAVNRVNSGEIDFDEIDGLPLDGARERLKKIVGVGDKVADCVLLFAFHKLDAFPRDVWVKRLMAEFYPEGLPECTKGAEGVAQQYLFDYVRNNDGLKV